MPIVKGSPAGLGARGLLTGAACIGLVFAWPAWAETTLERIKRTGELTVGTEAAFPPFEFIKDGKIVGYGADILAEVVKELGVKKLNQLDLPWQGILPGVLAGKFDFVATTVGMNEERAKRYAYTMPIADGMPYAMKRKGNPISKIEDLNGKVVGTQLASSTEPVARALDAKLKAGGGSGFKDLKLFPSFPESYVALANGEIDAVIQSLPQGNTFAPFEVFAAPPMQSAPSPTSPRPCAASSHVEPCRLSLGGTTPSRIRSFALSTRSCTSSISTRIPTTRPSSTT